MYLSCRVVQRGTYEEKKGFGRRRLREASVGEYDSRFVCSSCCAPAVVKYHDQKQFIEEFMLDYSSIVLIMTEITWQQAVRVAGSGS